MSFRYKHHVRFFVKICRNGHVSYWEKNEFPNPEEFCTKCGESYILHCSSCDIPIPNSFLSMKSRLDGKPLKFPELPEFCGGCGNPFPWTETKHKQIESAGLWSLMHHRVTEVAKPKFEAGFYADAVSSAHKELSTTIKQIVGDDLKGNLDGTKLMRNVFMHSNPKILLSDTSTATGKNIQEGLEHIFAGSMQAFRNPNAHENIKIDSSEAYHQLMLVSLLFHKIDQRISKR